MKRRSILAFGLGSPLALLGCATPGRGPVPGTFRAAHFQRPPRGSVLLHLHLPVTKVSVRAHAGAFSAGDFRVQRLVEERLVDAGYRVERIGPWQLAPVLRESLVELARNTPAPTDEQLDAAAERALSTLAAQSCGATPAAAVLQTRFVMRQAPLWQSVAHWDGVARQIVFAGAKPGEVKANIQGDGQGVSLEMVAVACDGSRLLKTFGGVSLPFEATAGGFFTRPVDDPLAEASHLAEGIGLALGPLIAD